MNHRTRHIYVQVTDHSYSVSCYGYGTRGGQNSVISEIFDLLNLEIDGPFERVSRFTPARTHLCRGWRAFIHSPRYTLRRPVPGSRQV